MKRTLKKILVFSLSLIVLWGCQSTPPEQMSLTERVQAYSTVLKKLGSSVEEDRTEAIQRFLSAGKQRGGEVVVYFLEDKATITNERVRVNLAGILAQWKDTRGVPFLLEHFHTKDKWVRSIVAQSLVVYGNNIQVVDYVGEQLVSSSSVSTRRLAASVLSRVGSEKAAWYLSRRLKDSDQEVRAECIEGIINSPQSRLRLGYLFDALTDPDSGLRQIAWWAIQKTYQGRKIPVQFNPTDPDEGKRAVDVAQLRRWAGFSKVKELKTRT